MIHFYDGSSQNESSCASHLAARAKSQSEVQRHVKFIVELVSEGARNAPTIFQTFSSTGSQFIVNYIYSSDAEGAKTAISCKPTIFGANSVKLIETRTSQQSTMLYFNGGSSRLIVGYIYSSNSEGACSPPTTFTITQALNCQRLIVVFIAANESNHAGAWAQATSFQTSKLIVIYSKKSLHFREDCGMFWEGEWEEQSQQPKHDLVDHYRVIGRADLINRISIVGQDNLVGHPGFSLVGHTGLGLDGISLVGLGFIGVNGLISVVSLVDHISLLVGQISLVNPIGLKLISHFCLNSRLSILDFIGHNSLIGFIDLGVSFVGLSLDSLGGLISHISLVGRCIIGLIELAASSNHWPISLIGVIGICLIASSASAASLARRLISFVGLIGSSTHRLSCERLATAVNEATKITWRLKQAAALGVATLRLNCSLNLFFYHLVAPHAFAREGEDLVVARSREEKDVAVDCLFWRILQR